jgi:hypothetical protein
MSREIELSCRCGAVHGRVTNASAEVVNRSICYCDDCQAYAHWLHREDLLDAHGGSDIVQVAPATLSFDRGQERIRGLRLTGKGLYRWYASCCSTPLGNTLHPGIPFVGIPVQSFAGGLSQVTDAFGPVRGAVFGKFAVGSAPPGSTRIDWRLMAGIVRRVLGWRLSGKSWPHPFFDRESRAARYPVTSLTSGERDALRPLCGPHPAATGA